MKVVDFFCGGGGFSEGFRQAGFDIVFAVDKWEPAIITYKGNKPGVNVVLDDVIRISNLPDDQFEALVPDSEVIIGSPPCQSFSHSNKSGNADKSIGIKLIKAYLKIIARKKYKKNSILKYWVLENVPSVKEYIEDEYTAEDLGLEGSFVLRPHGGNSGKYNAKYYGAPTNRQRYLCGEFPPLQRTNEDNNVKTLGDVLKTLGDPLSPIPNEVTDLNYPTLVLPKSQVTDHQYIYELAPFEWKTAERLKRDKGYMGKMSFPENLEKPARTVMATMSASSREAMILEHKEGKYRLPTVREAASMMSFPIDYDLIQLVEDNNQTNNYLIQSTVNFLFDADIFSINMFYYDSVQQQYRFKNESFPLKLSSVRNVLISQGFLCVDRGVTGSRFYVSPEYESLVASQCIRKRKAISLEQLKKRLKSDELAGEKAELFVVKYEKKRLGVEGENKVKRISEIDVTAGYDIVSANSPNSTVANRFIEVKAVSENGFYWSKNEYDIAKLLAADYYLYLVDLSKIDDDNYEPDIIHNPVQHIMENNLWLVEPQSYHIQKVKF